MQESDNIIVSLEKWLEENKQINLSITVCMLSFMSMLFHFTTVYFFTLQLESLAMVWAFLWLGNLFAFFFDIPIWILQYYFRSKTLYAFWVVAQIFAMTIFANFIFSVTSFVWEGIVDQIGVAQSILSFFLLDAMNILLLVVAAMCYGFAKEVNDITTISYILNNAHPNQYKSIIARNNIFFGVGSFLGLFLSWIILTFAPELILVNIVFMALLILGVMYFFFDNSASIVDKNNIKSLYFTLQGSSWKKTKNSVTQVVWKINMNQVLENTRHIILNPVRVNKEKRISRKEIIEKTSLSFKEIQMTLSYSMQNYMIVYWSFIMLLTFGFWDTFASTFLIDFLDSLKPGWSFILLGLIAIPAFWLQSIFWKLADKVWVFKIASIGLFLSSSSLITMAFYASSGNIAMILFLALINSVGYSICMSLSVGTFLESYNIAYANKKSLKQIDANASAAPMKILQNLANVIGLFLGGMILSFAWFSGFFFVFGLFILFFLVWSIVWKKSIQTQ